MESRTIVKQYILASCLITHEEVALTDGSKVYDIVAYSPDHTSVTLAHSRASETNTALATAFIAEQLKEVQA